jgi:short-subunit dehydrogenase
VTALCPGATRSKFAEKANILHTRMFRFMVMDAGRVAKVGYRALFKGKKVAVPGFYNKLLVSSIRFTPRWLVLKLGWFLMS